MTDQTLSGHKVAVLATDGFEQSELEKPVEALKAAGAEVEVVSPKSGQIQGWEHHDKGRRMQHAARRAFIAFSVFLYALRPRSPRKRAWMRDAAISSMKRASSPWAGPPSSPNSGPLSQKISEHGPQGPVSAIFQ